jgi:hypothetical protein
MVSSPTCAARPNAWLWPGVQKGSKTGLKTLDFSGLRDALHGLCEHFVYSQEKTSKTGPKSLGFAFPLPAWLDVPESGIRGYAGAGHTGHAGTGHQARSLKFDHSKCGDFRPVLGVFLSSQSLCLNTMQGSGGGQNYIAISGLFLMFLRSGSWSSCLGRRTSLCGRLPIFCPENGHPKSETSV